MQKHQPQCSMCDKLSCADRHHWEAENKLCSAAIPLFDHELSMFKSAIVKQFAQYCIDKAPEDFITKPASASGKYHPAFATSQDAGLIKHTKAAIMVANDLRDQTEFHYINWQQQRDIILLALMFHDVLKYHSRPGDKLNGYTNPEHAKLSADWLKQRYYEWLTIKQVRNASDIMKIVDLASLCILTHMGQWDTHPYSKNKKVRRLQRFVHLCDYIAAQKWMGTYTKQEQEVPF